MNKRTKHMKKYIPNGLYCYDHHGLCRFWKLVKAEEDWLDNVVRCEYLAQNFQGNWLLNDQCKICDLHDSFDYDLGERRYRRYHWYKKHRWELKQDAKEARNDD